MRNTTTEKKIVAQKIGELIHGWRSLHKLTQIEAALILEISQPTLSKIEGRGILPSADIWYKMAVRAGFPFDAPFREIFADRVKYAADEEAKAGKKSALKK